MAKKKKPIDNKSSGPVHSEASFQKKLPTGANVIDQKLDNSELPYDTSPLTGKKNKKPAEYYHPGTKVPKKLGLIKHLTDKHLYFCKRYALNGANAAKAARESGFDEWYARVNLVHSPLIANEILRIRAERSAKFNVSQERIIAECAKVAFGNLSDFLTINKDGTPVIDCEDVSHEEIAAVQEIVQDVYYERDGEESVPVKKTKIKLHGKIPALDLLAKLLGINGNSEDKETGEEKARRIRNALKAMLEVDGL